MRLHPFELIEPATVGEAIAALAGHDGDARPVAGGTALVPMIRLGLLQPERVVALHGIAELGGIHAGPAGLELGATVTHAELERAPAVRAGWPLLAEAAATVASPAIRTMATVGGNLAYAEAASDLLPALLVLDAEVRVAGGAGARAIAAAGFFRGFYEAALDPGELVTGARVPAAPAGARSGYVKFCPRVAEDKPLVGVAALLVLDGAAGRVEDLRLALGGAAPTPLRARRAEATVRAEPLTDGAIRAAAEAAAAEADPLSDLMGSADYRRDMVRVWVRRLLTALRDGAPVPRWR
jgi:carbon-monoxide dehydrogenase medium subunit